jgi:uncharacterized protein DUF6941
MKLTLLLAEAATTHPDGTVSILRAGINRAVNHTAPIPLAAALVARVDGDINEGASNHKFSVRLFNEDGRDVIPKVEGGFVLPPEWGAVNLVFNLQAAFPKHGRYSFHLNVDDIHHAQWSVEVTPHPPRAPKSG